ncbi:MAG: nuclease, partial [Thiohalomonadales bacterium]
SKNNIWINLGSKFVLRIDKSNLIFFKKINFDKLPEKKIIARGYVAYNPKEHQFHMLVRHPIALEISR